jgi:hypothetical protein
MARLKESTCTISVVPTLALSITDKPVAKSMKPLVANEGCHQAGRCAALQDSRNNQSGHERSYSSIETASEPAAHVCTVAT